MFLSILAVLGCLWGNALAGYSQFFYTGSPVPLQQNYYRPALPAFQPYVQPQVFYNPVQQYYTHPGFTYHHTAPVATPVPAPAPAPVELPPTVQGQSSNGGTRVSEENDSIEVNAEPAQQTQTQAPVAARTFNFERRESNAFRGFAYHTEYDDGARSNVVFLTGPEIHNYQSPIQKSTNTHTPASDALDSNALKEEAQPRTFAQNPSIRVLMDFLQNPQVGVQKFYSVDNNLVARRLEDDYPTFPASTLPLSTPVSPIFSILRSNFNQEPQQEVRVDQRSNPEPLPLASEINSNTVDLDASATTTTTTSTTSEPFTTVAVTEASTTTTEAVSSTAETTEASTSSMAPIVVEDSTEDSKEESSR